MAIRKISFSVISGMLLAGGIFAASPALAVDAPVPTATTGKVVIPPDYMTWGEWRCPSGSRMSDFVITAGPNTHLGTQYALPENDWSGSGFGRDIINMSHTSSSWYEVSYSCSTPPPIKVKKIFDIAGAHSVREISEKTLACPINYPWIGEGEGRQISGLDGSISIQSYKVDQSYQEGRGTFQVMNASRVSGQVELTITCHSKKP